MNTRHADLDAEKLLHTFLDMVRIDSPSGDEGKMRDHLLARFKSLNVPCEVDAKGNVFVTVPGHQNTGDMTLLVTGHLDVVPPCLGVKPVIEGDGDERVIRSSGDTVLGADDKAALTTILEALEYSMAHNTPRPHVLMVLTVEEETCLEGAKAIDPKQYEKADFAIAFDTTGDQGIVIHEAPTYVYFKITVNGRSAHAGSMPERGINAIHLLSQALRQFNTAWVDENTTCNPALIQGGRATNVVPDIATVEGEMRSHDRKRLDQEIAYMNQVLTDTVGPVDGASFDFFHEEKFAHYCTDVSDPYVQHVAKAIESVGITPTIKRSNGASDINVFANHGVPGVVLAAGFREAHTLTEHVYLRDIVTATDILLATWEVFATS